MTSEPAATIHSAAGSSTPIQEGRPKVCSPDRPAATSEMTRRSARSMSPLTATGSPIDSPRALVYETTCPLARQKIETAHSALSFPLPAYQSASPPKIAASATRSRVESRKAPQRLETPAWRAMFPSTRSEKTKRVMVMVPQKNSPRGRRPALRPPLRPCRSGSPHPGSPPPEQKSGEWRENTRKECTRVLVQHGLPGGSLGRTATTATGWPIVASTPPPGRRAPTGSARRAFLHASAPCRTRLRYDVWTRCDSGAKLEGHPPPHRHHREARESWEPHHTTPEPPAGH